MELPVLKPVYSNPDRKAIQETSFSKDVLARFQCNSMEEVLAANDLPGTLPFTAIVIGSGMYGAFCAERIYRRGGRVLVLEAGPFVVSEHVQNMADPAFDVVQTDDLLGQPAFGEFRSPIFNDLKQPLNYAEHSYHVGGKSVRWGGWSPRLTDEDLQLWPAEIRQYLKDYYREIEFQIGAYPTADFIKGPLAEVLFSRARALKGTNNILQVLPAPIAVQAEQPASGLFSFDKYSSLTLLLEALRSDARASFDRSQSKEDATSRRGIVLVPRCRVLRLETEPADNGRKRVSGLRVIHGYDDGRVIDVLPVPNGCAVVLAANSMESTRLALDSFVEHHKAAATKIGRNLQVHLRTDIIVRISRASFEKELREAAQQRVESKQSYESELDAPDLRTVEDQVKDMLKSLQTAALHIQCSDGTRRFHLQLLAVNDPSANPESLLYRQDTSLPELLAILGSQRSEFVAIKFILVGEMLTDRHLAVGDPSTSWAALSEIQRDYYVGHGNPQNVDQSYSARKLYTHIRLTQEDEKLWLKMDKLAIEVARKLAGPNGVIEYFYANDNNNERSWHLIPPNDAQLRNLHHSLGSTYHESGTMWMDPDPNSGVVDTTGRLHEVINCYCSDQSVFVTSGSANPVPTGLVIAKRVSEAIQPDHERSDDDFQKLFVFPPDPKGDYTSLPSDLASMPKGWNFIGQGAFVRRGKILETSGGIGLLYFADEVYKDFVLKVEWRCPIPRGNYNFFNNSGIYIRWPQQITVQNSQKRRPEALSLEEFNTYAIKQGYEIQIDDTGYRPKPDFSGHAEELGNFHHLTGAIYPAFFPKNSQPPFKVPRFDSSAGSVDRTGSPSLALASRPPGEWNLFVISARGNHIKVELNGNVVNDATDFNNAYPEGFIGIQNHFNGYRVQFRNLNIKKL